MKNYWKKTFLSMPLETGYIGSVMMNGFINSSLKEVYFYLFIVDYLLIYKQQ